MNEKYQYELGEWVVMVVKYNRSDTIHTIVTHKIFYILAETSLLSINVREKQRGNKNVPSIGHKTQNKDKQNKKHNTEN